MVRVQVKVRLRVQIRVSFWVKVRVRVRHIRASLCRHAAHFHTTHYRICRAECKARGRARLRGVSKARARLWSRLDRLTLPIGG